MPFENHGDLSFTATSIAKNAPPASGVYGLGDACKWIYIGETADIQAELLRHLDNPPAFLRQYPRDSYCGTTIDRQSQLVLEFEPIGNRRVGHLSKWTPAGEEHRSDNH